jgi:hypothetical protein
MSSQASRLTRVLFSCPEQKKNRQQLALTDSLRDAKSTTKLEQDSPNGEQSSKLEMVALLTFLSLKLHTLLPDTQLSAKRTALHPSLSLKFSLMETTQLRSVLKSLRESLPPALSPSSSTTSSLRAASLSPTWSPKVLSAPRRQLSKRSHGSQCALSPELSHLP